MTKTENEVIPLTRTDPIKDMSPAVPISDRVREPLLFAQISYRGTLPPDLEAVIREVTEPARERVHIIAPPGSGKMLLGAELVRRYAKPCLLISPDEASRDLWLTCWREDFLPADTASDASSLLSVLTYDEVVSQLEARDARQSLREAGVQTLLLDEPCGLPESVYAVVERLIESLPDVRVIGLSSRPCVGDETERIRCMALCGDVRAELSSAELVRRGILLPHADLLYLATLTEDEREATREACRAVSRGLAALMKLPFMREVCRRLWSTGRRYLYRHRAEVLAVTELAATYGDPGAVRIHRALTGSSMIPSLTAIHARDALVFLTASRKVLADWEKDRLTAILSKYGLSLQGKAWPSERESIRRLEARSLGKVDGIRRIVETEIDSLGDALRLWVCMPASADAPADGMLCNAQVVFDSLTASAEAPVGGVIDGRLLLPCGLGETIRHLYGIPVTEEPIGRDCAPPVYSLYHADTPADAAFVRDRLFDEGYIRILVTDGDLAGGIGGERLANTLILPLSPTDAGDQDHRGLTRRAHMLRTRRDDPRRTVHIWHMATVHLWQGADDGEIAFSEDLAGVIAAFDSIPGPDESAPRLISGLERLGLGRERVAVLSSDERDGFHTYMLGRTRDRRRTIRGWLATGKPDEPAPVRPELVLPRQSALPAVTPLSVIGLLAALLGACAGGYALVYLSLLVKQAIGLPLVTVIMAACWLVAAVVVVWSVLYLGHRLPFVLCHRTRRASILSVSRALLSALQATGAVGDGAEVVVSDETVGKAGGFSVGLRGASRVESERYVRALREFLSPIEDPRYVLARRGLCRRPLWRLSFACPSDVAKRDIAVQIFARELRRTLGRVEIVYTRHEAGRRRLGRAQSASCTGRTGTSPRVRVQMAEP